MDKSDDGFTRRNFLKIGREVEALFFWIFMFLFIADINPSPSLAHEYDMPNHGSPYANLMEAANGEIIHLPTGLKVDFDGLIEVISSSRVIYIGETHDNLAAHEVQLRIIGALQKRFPGHLAVGMEMFRRSGQEALDQWWQGNLDDRYFKRLFYKHWGGDYRLYQKIFNYIRENRLPLLALKSSVKTQLRFKREGESNPETFPELDLSDPYHQAYSRSVFGGHSDYGSEHDPYRTLLLWEETMAKTISDFLRDGQRRDWRLVVLAGGFHVQYGFGIPKRAFRRVPHSYSIVLPTVTKIPQELDDRRMDVKAVPIPLYSADFVWKLPYEVLPENKIKLGVFLEEVEEGVLVKSVKDYGNAANAGILKNDVLIRFDGQPIDSLDDLIARLQEIEIGAKEIFRIRREGVEIDVEIIFEK